MSYRLIYPERAMHRMPVLKSTRQTKSFFTLAVYTALLSVMSAWAYSNDAPVSVLRLGHGLDTRHPVHRALVKMAEDLEARSGGTLQMVIGPRSLWLYLGHSDTKEATATRRCRPRRAPS